MTIEHIALLKLNDSEMPTRVFGICIFCADLEKIVTINNLLALLQNSDVINQ